MTQGTLIIGYGTRAGDLTAILDTQAARLRARGRRNVRIAYFRVSEPSIPEALSAMAAEGIDDVLAVPYYIAEGTITREFIPGKLGISGSAGVADVDGRPVRIAIAPAFNRTRVLTGIVFDRIAGAGGTFDDGILLIGHGTRDPASENTRVVAMNAERVRRAGYRRVAHAFNEFNQPSIRAAMRGLAESGAERIIVVPLFIANGVHLGEEVPEQLGIPPYSEGGTVDVGLYEKELEQHHHSRAADLAATVPVWDATALDALTEAVRSVSDWAAEHSCSPVGGIEAVVSRGDDALAISVDGPGSDIVVTGSLPYGGRAEAVVTIPNGSHELAHRMYHAMDRDGFVIHQSHEDLHHHHHEDPVRTGRTVDIVYTRPVGADPRLLELIDSEIAEFGGERRPDHPSNHIARNEPFRSQVHKGEQ